MQIDNKDKILLNELQKNARESLTILAKKLNLSIDSTHKRLKKLEKEGIIDHYSAMINPKKLGFELIANIQIKLNNISEDELNKFIAYLTAHKNVSTLLTLIGDYDITCVLHTKNTEELEEVSRTIRQKFKNIITDWCSVINLKCYKLEKYEL